MTEAEFKVFQAGATALQRDYAKLRRKWSGSVGDPIPYPRPLGYRLKADPILATDEEGDPQD